MTNRAELKTFNILSIDWDFFFPNAVNFDWGHRESSFFMYDAWYLRTNSHHLMTKERALDAYHPRENYRNLWDVHIQEAPKRLYIAESHLRMWQVLGNLKAAYPRSWVRVWNMDAHHDLGYSEQERKGDRIDCASWAYFGLFTNRINQYHLVYPAWRKDEPEENLEEIREGRVTIDYSGFQSAPFRSPDYIFICRSPSWCPSWADDKWLDFIAWWRDYYPGLWRRKQCLDEKVLEHRSPTLEEAEEIQKQTAQAFDSIEGIKSFQEALKKSGL